MEVGTITPWFTVGRIHIGIYPSEADAGRAAAAHTAQILSDRVAAAGSARIAIATGNSQLAFIRALRDETEVPWRAVEVFHLDEYVGIDADHPASFHRWIRDNVELPFGPAAVHYIDGKADDPTAEAARYADLLDQRPLDLACIGIGENGHLAFNEPGVSDPDDPSSVRVISLAPQSLHQQVNEGHFPDIGSVPAQAITLTVPTLLRAGVVQAVTPETRKAPAVRATLTDAVSTACPATILRERGNTRLFLDRDSAALVDAPTEPRQ